MATGFSVSMPVGVSEAVGLGSSVFSLVGGFCIVFLLSGVPDGEPCFRSNVAGNEDSMRCYSGIASHLNK